ncbi:hypothetical protein, partial [Escherichia coli]|uniref:hypothetical protein n=1 Tax=Escherichia coli TaxID=562 RepID=UPI001BC91525
TNSAQCSKTTHPLKTHPLSLILIASIDSPNKNGSFTPHLSFPLLQFSDRAIITIQTTTSFF